MIWCIPGFLGRPSDWEAFATSCRGRGLPQVQTAPLFNRVQPKGLVAWGEGFARRVARQDASPVLMGYSLGGRLGLHALLARPALWRGAILVSTHLGYDDADRRRARRGADAAWARRVERDAWDAFMRDWDAQEAFHGHTRRPERPECEYSRAALAHALRAWSLGMQQPLAERLAVISCPVLWVAGRQDTRFLAEGERAMQYLPRGTLAVAPRAAHRVPWEAADWFLERTRAFLSNPG